MSLELTNRTERALQETNIKPNIIFKIDGYDILFSALPILELIRINDPGLFIDGTWFIGGLRAIENNRALIDSKLTTTKINQQMNYDEARGSSISSMTIGLVDKDEFLTKLISPGVVLEDVLGRKASVLVTYGDVSFFEDSVEVFKGFITTIDSGPGNVRFKINHPDNKKKVDLFKNVETALTDAVNASQTTVGVESTSTYLLPQGPLTTYIRIEDELINYTGYDATNFTGLTRGALNSTATAHDDEAQVRALYCLEGNPLDLALQIMMSGFGTDPVYEDIEITSFVKVGAGSDEIPNSIFFNNVNVPQEYNLRAGDTATITGATNAANNITTAVIDDVVQFENGYYVTFTGVSLVLEGTTSATVNFFSQFNTLPDGMRMKPDEVDIDEHLRIRDFFHSSTEFRIYIKEDEIPGKEFLDEQLYKPIACYSLPRKARASVGYTIGPIPGDNIKTLDITNVRNARDLRLTRTTNNAFFNEVFYKYEDTPIDPSIKFTRGSLFISQTSKNRIPGTTKTQIIESLGLRTDLNAVNIIASNSQRILDRYKFGAQKINPRVQLSTAVSIEIGDIVVCDLIDLQVTDTTIGSRQFVPRFFEVQDKSLNIKTGEVEMVCLDTGLGLDTRYSLISPCSPISSVISSSQFVIGPDPMYPSKYGNDEFRKWESVIGPRDPISIRVHNTDYSVDEDLVVSNIEGNTFTLQDPATITLASGLIVEFTGYVDSDTSSKQKLIYGYMTDDANFPDGENPYTMI